MAKFRGVIGFAEGETAVRPGVWEETIVEHTYRGDVVRNSRQLRENEKVNDDISVGNSISIVADAYAREHFFAMRYIKWAGTYWDVDDVEVVSPRLILRLGGVNNGNRPGTPPETP